LLAEKWRKKLRLLQGRGRGRIGSREELTGDEEEEDDRSRLMLKSID
jgi:hypothetical protein